MIIVASLDRAQEAFKRYRPAMVLSMLDVESVEPVFPGLAPQNHIKLWVEKTGETTDLKAVAKAKAERLAEIFSAWDGRKDVLIHCTLGVARSMAAAFVVQCMFAPERSEEEIAAALRAAAPHADPCLHLVSQADELLGRDGRMIEAIADLCPACTTDSAPIVALPLAA